MRNAPIRCHAGAAADTICVLLVALAGCAQNAAPPRAAGPSAAESPPAITPATATAEPAAAAPAAEGGETVAIGACDGSPAVEVPKSLTGQPLADSLMDQWQRDHPEANWVAEQKERHALIPPADNSERLKGDQGRGHPWPLTRRPRGPGRPRNSSPRDRGFSTADELGSTVAVSCDMCHPHVTRTRKRIPKYQTQLGRVALLRDMIDWCIENPVRGEHLDPNGPKMRALEAYIQSQRKGVALDYGKH